MARMKLLHDRIETHRYEALPEAVKESMEALRLGI